MSLTRRNFLRSGAAAPVASALGGLSALGALGLAPGLANAADYRALVVLFLTGGNDGHNTLVPTDGAFSDYQRSRTNLALAKSSLVTLSGQSAGHSFGLHPALAALAPLYEQRRLAWIANAGALVVPTSGAQARANAVDIPPFLGSHSDQVLIQQGWTVADDLSGWAGRGIELLPSSLRHALNATTMSNNSTLVQGRHSSPAFLSPFGSPQHWGSVNLGEQQSPEVQALRQLARQQSANVYANQYLRTLEQSINDSILFTSAAQRGVNPTQDFGNNNLADQFRRLASMMPSFKADGFRRQVFLVEYGAFDTHTNQRGSDSTTQDSQLAVVGKAVAAFDEANRASGIDQNVVTLMLSDFGRSLRPASGGGSEHGWGNHIFALGGPVNGGQVLGTFPDLTLGGPDDGDAASNGRHVPSTSTDQVAATVMQWLGLAPAQFNDVFPWLANFAVKTIPLLRAA